MKQKFVNVGFEFTAGITKGEKLNSNFRRGTITRGSIIANNRDSMSKYQWICDNFKNDECGCEVPTPIVTNTKDVTRYFNEFKNFVVTNGFSIDLHTANCGLGGCHIHLGLEDMTDEFKTRFLKNVGIFLTNHPQLNWAFNDPNDNCNANSMLTEYGLSSNQISIFAKNNIETVCYVSDEDESEVETSLFEIPQYKDTHILNPFKDDKIPLNAYLSNPLRVFLKKRFALRYNEDYKTLELRIFDMPKSLKQHILHYDVAMAIYNYCYETTLKKEEFSKLYHNWYGYTGESLAVAQLKFDECIQKLGINKNRVKEARANIATRYEWTDFNKGNKSKNFYLY